MKPVLLFLFNFVFLIFLYEYSYSQQTLLTAGGEASGSGGLVDYSVGQTAFITLSGSQGTVTEGVQQPYEILFNGIYEPGIGLECVAYPNPAHSFIRLKIKSRKIINLSFRLYTLNGMILNEGVITEEETKIPVDELSAGTYLLTVLENNIALNSYKIIKQ